MLYFVQNKKVHRFPIPRRCGAVYSEEGMRDTIPQGYEECIYCLRSWPGDREE